MTLCARDDAEGDLTRIVSAIRAAGLAIRSVTVDSEGSMTVAMRPPARDDQSS